jgi:hypothetical protein
MDSAETMIAYMMFFSCGGDIMQFEYMYVAGNPIKYNDPSGHGLKRFSLAMGAAGKF